MTGGDDRRWLESTKGRCSGSDVRAGKAFVAMLSLESDGMVIELPAVRVSQLIASGVAAPLAPADKVLEGRVEIAATEDWRREERSDFVGG